MTYPRPFGYTGVNRDGGILRHAEGRIGINVNTPGELAADADYRRNAHDDFESSDLGGNGDEDY